MKNTKSAKLFALLTALLLLLSTLPISAAAADEITVYMSVSVRGELARGKDGTIIACVPLALEDGSATVHEAIAALTTHTLRGVPRPATPRPRAPSAA